MFSIPLTALLLSGIASVYVASSGNPQINFPPCTDTVCITPCGFKHIEAFSLNVTGFPVDTSANFFRVSVGVTTDKKITSLNFRIENIEAESVMGPHHVEDVTLDVCEQERDNGNKICPILPHVHVTFSKTKQLGWLKSIAKGISCTITAIDQDQETIACAEVRVVVPDN